MRNLPQARVSSPQPASGAFRVCCAPTQPLRQAAPNVCCPEGRLGRRRRILNHLLSSSSHLWSLVCHIGRATAELTPLTFTKFWMGSFVHFLGGHCELMMRCWAAWLREATCSHRVLLPVCFTSNIHCCFMGASTLASSFALFVFYNVSLIYLGLKYTQLQWETIANCISIVHLRVHSGYQVENTTKVMPFNLKVKCVATVHLSTHWFSLHVYFFVSIITVCVFLLVLLQVLMDQHAYSCYCRI